MLSCCHLERVRSDSFRTLKCQKAALAAGRVWELGSVRVAGWVFSFLEFGATAGWRMGKALEKSILPAVDRHEASGRSEVKAAGAKGAQVLRDGKLRTVRPSRRHRPRPEMPKQPSSGRQHWRPLFECH
jgi:hypothetical protein